MASFSITTSPSTSSSVQILVVSVPEFPALTRFVNHLSLSYSCLLSRELRIELYLVYVENKKDPEGLFSPAQTGHIARSEFRRSLDKDADAKAAFERQIREEKERRRAARQARVVPDTPAELVEFFLDTEAQEIEVEIARLRPQLNKDFFAHLQFELGQLRFAVSKTQATEDELIELEALQKALQEGTEAYDNMQTELVKARQSLTKILSSKDIKATLLDCVEQNELNRSLLTLLDENIASAQMGDQKQAAAAEFMEKLCGAVLKYMTASVAP